MCSRCNRAHGFGRPPQDRETLDLLAEIATRIWAPAPLRPCDDPTTWDWRRYLGKKEGAAEATPI